MDPHVFPCNIKAVRVEGRDVDDAVAVSARSPGVNVRVTDLEAVHTVDPKCPVGGVLHNYVFKEYVHSHDVSPHLILTRQKISLTPNAFRAGLTKSESPTDTPPDINKASACNASLSTLIVLSKSSTTR